MTDSNINSSGASAEVVELDIDGTRYSIRLPQSSTDYIQKKIATEKQPYERDMLEDMRTRLAPGELVLDVGANVGNHTLYLATVAGCLVEAFEANTDLCEAMRSSIALNGLGDRVGVHWVGVGSAAGKASFAEAVPENLGAQKLAVGDGEIDVITLDSLSFAQPVRMLKVDVEGMELDVLHGARGLISRDRPVLYVECIGERDLRQVLRWIDELDYSYWETFNATPTHLFLPSEAVSVEQRLTRLQLMAYREETRTVQLLSSVRQKLTRAYDNEREATRLNVEMTQQLTESLTQGKSYRARIATLVSELDESRTDGKRVTAQLVEERQTSSSEISALISERDRSRADEQASAAKATALASELGSLRDTLSEAREQFNPAQGDARRQSEGSYPTSRSAAGSRRRGTIARRREACTVGAGARRIAGGPSQPSAHAGDQVRTTGVHVAQARHDRATLRAGSHQ